MTKYVSQLAFPTSPGRFVFAAGLILGGILLMPHARGLRHLTPNHHGLRASWLGQVAAVAMVLVGFFPLTLPVAHFGCAFVLFAAAIFTTLFVGLGLRERARDADHPGPLRRGGAVLIGVFVFMLVMTVAGFVHTAFAYRHVTSTAPDAILKELPKHQLVRSTTLPDFNPVALQEWVFLILAMALVLAASLSMLRSGSGTAEKH